MDLNTAATSNTVANVDAPDDDQANFDLDDPVADEIM
jgi:hypothetical protein